MRKKLTIFLLICTMILCFGGCTGSISESYNNSAPQHNLKQPVLPIIWDGSVSSQQTEAPLMEMDLLPLKANCKLIVSGKDITEGNYININYDARNAELPVLAILNELGHAAEMRYNEETDSYIAVIDHNESIIDSSKEDFGITIPQGKNGCIRKLQDNDFIIDSESLFTPLYWIWGAKITIDYSTFTVYVDSVDPYAYEEYECTLLVNGTDITEGNYVRIVDYAVGSPDAQIPILAIVKELGAHIEWQGDTVIITYNGSSEIFDTTDPEYTVMAPPGSVAATRKIENGDLIFDSPSIEGFLKNMFHVEVKVDLDNLIVSIVPIEE